MIPVQQLRTWASGLDLSGHVGIDEGGLTLVEIPEHDRLSGAYLEVGGCDEDPDPADPPPTRPTTDTEPVSAAPGSVVVSVADLLALVGGTLTRAELPRVRAAIRKSSVGDTFSEVVFAVITARRHELITGLREFFNPGMFTGRLGRGPLAEVPGDHIGRLFGDIEIASELSLMRVCCGDAARLCVLDRKTDRLFDLGEIFDAWLHGDAPLPGPLTRWIGEAVDDFTYDELTRLGPHDYRLPAPAPAPGRV
ncbi:hypothetical protein [Nocardia noduli]|uniref:hypothetical protein n=1 Tax=Nocardia noduli TaxID=2815722 RepID=UPI001C247FE9|nr:hypothetical protein [Nocardia noduli]